VRELVLALLALAGGGAVAQAVAERRDRRALPAPGRYVRVGDAEVHVVVEGRGPVVLLDSGLGGSSIEWAQVAAGLRDDFTVVRYDRPGLAWSTGSTADRRAKAAASRILQLLDVLELPGPVILVGHSLGGIHVRLAAALAPDRIRGLVLVDPSHEGMLGIVESSREAAVTRGVLRAVSRLAPLGVGRLAGRLFAKLALSEAREALDADELRGARTSALLTSRTAHGLRALSAEQDCLADSLRQLTQVTQPAAIRLTVITAAAPSATRRVADARAEIDRMHADHVRATAGARHVLAERSGHLIPLDQPEIIVQSVREMADA
jgi:pimeloyl-ACP methyl ester carboxylesterase